MVGSGGVDKLSVLDSDGVVDGWSVEGLSVLFIVLVDVLDYVVSV